MKTKHVRCDLNSLPFTLAAVVTFIPLSLSNNSNSVALSQEVVLVLVKLLSSLTRKQ